MANTKKRIFWMSITNLMTVLMVIFLLIAVSYMGKDNTIQITKEYNNEIKQAFIELLENKELLGAVLEKNGVSVDTNNLTLTFTNESYLFSSGKAGLTEGFKKQLSIVFPTLIQKIEANNMLLENLVEIRIEGHTDNIWHPKSTPHQSLIANMGLSQSRAIAVFRYIMSLPSIKSSETQLPWYYHRISALGMSFNNPALITGGIHTNKNADFPSSKQIDRQKSRRVTIALIIKEYIPEEL